MAGRYTHQNLSCPTSAEDASQPAWLSIVRKEFKSMYKSPQMCLHHKRSVSQAKQAGVVTVRSLLHTVFTTHNSLAARTGNTFDVKFLNNKLLVFDKCFSPWFFILHN